MFSLLKFGRSLAIAVLLAPCCPAQQDQGAGEGQSIEPWVLRDMLLQSQPDTQVALLDQYRAELQNAEMLPWAFDQICEGFGSAGRIERALATGERLLALDPQAVEIAQRGLEAAQKKQDSVLVSKWTELRSRAASTVLAGPAP